MGARGLFIPCKIKQAGTSSRALQSLSLQSRRFTEPYRADRPRRVREKPLKLQSNMNVYIIQSGKYYKVGLANDVKKRMAGLQTSNPETLKLMYSVQFKNRATAKKAEAAMHRRFKKHRMRGEWFLCPLEDLERGLHAVAQEIAEKAFKAKKAKSVKRARENAEKLLSRQKTYNLIRASWTENVIIDDENILCLMTSGQGLSRKMRALLGLSNNAKSGWKKRVTGIAVNRHDYLFACDDVLKPEGEALK